MHARNRTWLLGSDPVERCRQRTLPVEGGDGSTLSLDFTTGVLDPRLTFTRTTNATFINSQGLVEWAQANLMTQSNAFTTSPWASTNVTMTTDGESPVGSAWRMTENSALASVHRLDPSVVTCSNGVISISVYVKQGSGTRQAYFLVSDNATGEVRSKRLNPADGSLQGTESTGGSWASASTSVVNVGGGWYRLVLTVTKGGGSGVIVRMGMSDSSGNLGYNGDGTSYLLFSGVQINPGPVQSYAETTGSIYQAPRFDYDPSTLQPRGLLIEGSASNLARYSETLETTGGFWGYNAATRTVESSDINPTGGTGSISFAPTTNGGSRYCGLFLTGQTTTTAYTYSVWLKGKGTTQCTISIQNNVGGQNATMTILSQPVGANASIAGNGTGFPRISNLSTTGWTKVQVVLSANLGGTGTLNVFMYPNDTSGQTTADSVYAWGAQLEAGSGASSYIPTGASQGSRGQDSATMAVTAAQLQFDLYRYTMLVRGRQNTGSTVGSFARSVRIHDATTEPIGFAVSGVQLFGTSRNASGGAIAEVVANNTLNQDFRFAWSLDANLATNTMLGSLNQSSLSAARTNLGPTSSPTALSLNNNSAATAYASMTIRDIKFFPTQYTAAQLQALTT